GRRSQAAMTVARSVGNWRSETATGEDGTTVGTSASSCCPNWLDVSIFVESGRRPPEPKVTGSTPVGDTWDTSRESVVQPDADRSRVVRVLLPSLGVTAIS